MELTLHKNSSLMCWFCIRIQNRTNVWLNKSNFLHFLLGLISDRQKNKFELKIIFHIIGNKSTWILIPHVVQSYICRLLSSNKLSSQFPYRHPNHMTDLYWLMKWWPSWPKPKSHDFTQKNQSISLFHGKSINMQSIDYVNIFHSFIRMYTFIYNVVAY